MKGEEKKSIQFHRMVTSTFPNLAILHVPIADMPDADLLTHLEETTKFLRRGLEGGGAVLVHCYHGVSRSASIVLAYLLKTRLAKLLFLE